MEVGEVIGKRREMSVVLELISMNFLQFRLRIQIQHPESTDMIDSCNVTFNAEIKAQYLSTI